MNEVNTKELVWHARLGRSGGSALTLISKNNVVEGMPDIGVYEKHHLWKGCVQGKLPGSSFGRRNEIDSRRYLELVYSNVGGPLQDALLEGSRYFLAFIEDFSRSTFLYPLKRKKDVLKMFIEFKSRVEVETGPKILKF